MPVKHLTEEHRALLTEKCSVLENPPLPDLPTVPKRKRDRQASAEEQELHRSKRPRNSVSKEEEEEEEDFEDLVLDYDLHVDDDNDDKDDDNKSSWKKPQVVGHSLQPWYKNITAVAKTAKERVNGK